MVMRLVPVGLARRRCPRHACDASFCALSGVIAVAHECLGPAYVTASGVDQERSPGASPLRPVVNTESAMAALDEAIEVHIAQQASRERDPRPSGPVEGIDPLPQLPFGLRTAAEPSAPTTDGQLGVAATLELLRDTPIAPPGGQTSSTNSATDTASQSQPAASPLSSPTASTVNPSPPPSSQGLQASPSMSSPPAQPQPLAGGGMSLAPPAGGGATDGGGGNGNGNGGLQALGPAAAAMPLIPPGGLVIGPDFEARSMAYERDLLRNQLKASAAEKEQLRKQVGGAGRGAHVTYCMARLSSVPWALIVPGRLHYCSTPSDPLFSSL